MKRSFTKRLWYNGLRVIFRMAAVVVFRVRCEGRRHIPHEGSLLVLSNHQSHLDPIMVGLAFDRRLNYVARESLFRFAPLRWFIRSLDAISIDLEGSPLGGLKETLKRLKHDEAVLIFPEGTRSVDGRVAPFRLGYATLARRAHATILPVAVEGTFDALPRQHLFPRPAVIQVHIGAPIWPDEIDQLADVQLEQEVRRRITDCHAQAIDGRRRRDTDFTRG